MTSTRTIAPTLPRITGGVFLLAIGLSASGCIAVGLADSKETQELMVSTSERVRKLEDRIDVIEMSTQENAERRLAERILRLERELGRLREENERLSQQLTQETDEQEEQAKP